MHCQGTRRWTRLESNSLTARLTHNSDVSGGCSPPLTPAVSFLPAGLPPGSLATIPDRAEFPHPATTARSGPSSKSPRLRAVRPGDAFSQLSAINPQPV
jgi:hypothetical protein